MRIDPITLAAPPRGLMQLVAQGGDQDNLKNSS